MNNNLELKFVGFNPDDRFKNTISQVAEVLYSSAPSDSDLKLVVEKSKNTIRASGRIVSQTGIFVADCLGHTPIRAIQKLERKMRKQLDWWKLHRFKNNQREKTYSNAI